ncbi:hypothetical protein BRADI_1g49862v3 [Brachypodium distachyon]|uniref:Uncharacterized protein n=1 Tax=Brachypodium distachyon TaxID=15368 RepID=A0A0Q3L988_BRADI|nr:hypothetical protein BRADI_1g49862v3 [Brachypodium distachyon]
MVEALSCQRSISRPLPAVVAPKSARPAVSLCGSSPANPVKKHSPLDIDWTAMFETGSTKLLETNLSPPALEVILPRQLILHYGVLTEHVEEQ